MPSFSCATCAAQFPPAEKPPPACPICEDERQYVAQAGHPWTSREELIESGHKIVFQDVEEGVTALAVEPKLGIGQRAYLLHTEAGTVLWDCVGLLHPDAVQHIKQQYGGITAIAISHPHFYCAMADWAEAFDCQVWVHEADRGFITCPSDRIQLWSGDEKQLAPGCTLVRLGGHFPGSSVLHWDRCTADGKPIVFAGDTVMPCMDRKWVTFMYSFPNYVPLPAGEVQRMAAAISRWPFDRLYGPFPGPPVGPDAAEKVQASAQRYCGVLEGTSKQTFT
ncbi:hypothetical protein ABPG77_011023 [Micractinium sp. CCAP 211/92]